jgi:hypothetical protein
MAESALLWLYFFLAIRQGINLNEFPLSFSLGRFDANSVSSSPSIRQIIWSRSLYANSAKGARRD